MDYVGVLDTCCTGILEIPWAGAGVLYVCGLSVKQLTKLRWICCVCLLCIVSTFKCGFITFYVHSLTIFYEVIVWCVPWGWCRALLCSLCYEVQQRQTSSATSFPAMPQWPGTQHTVSSRVEACAGIMVLKTRLLMWVLEEFVDDNVCTTLKESV